MKKRFFVLAAFACALMIVGCNGTDEPTKPKTSDSLSGYRHYFDSVRKVISAPDYYGRNGYGDGDVRATCFIIDEIRKIDGLETVEWMDPATEQVAYSEDCNERLNPGDIGRITKYGNEEIYAPYLQNFKARHNFFDGAMKVSIGGQELKNCDDYQMRCFSPGCHGTYKLAFLPRKAYTPKALKEYLESGEFKNTFVAVDPNTLGQSFWDYVGNTFVSLDPDKVSGIIQLCDYVNSKIGYSSVGVGWQTSVPVIRIKECKIPSGASEITVDIDNTMLQEHDSHNISVYLPGTNKNLSQYYVFTAHYDHHGTVGTENIYCGANDNASSSAMILTLAKYFSVNRPEYGIQFIWVDEEESGLYGSYYYTQNPAKPLDKIKFLINFEQTSDNGNSVWGACNTVGNTEFNKLLSINSSLPYAFSVTRAGFGDNSDHYPFGIRNVPVCYVATVGDNNNNYYHTTYDTYENTTSENFNRFFTIIVKYIMNDY